MKYITRIDDKSYHHGYSVRFGWDGNTAKMQKFFSDKRYQGKHNALVAARDFRNKNTDYIGDPDVIIPHKKRGKGVKSATARYRTQEKIGKRLIVVGTGFKAAEEAKEYGVSERTAWNVRNGKQDRFICFHRPPLCAYEVYGFTNEISPELGVQVRKEIETRRRDWCDLYISEAVSSVLLAIASKEYDDINRLITKVLRNKDVTINQKPATMSLDWAKEMYGFEPAAAI